jgi:HEAT repeat protein
VKSEALAAAWVALLPSFTAAQLSDHMAPSQPAAVKAAAARELASRLGELNWEKRRDEEAAFHALPDGVPRLVQLLTEPDDDDTQLAALEAVAGVWGDWSATEVVLQLLQLPGVVDTLVQLLHEGGAAKQAVAANALQRLFFSAGCSRVGMAGSAWSKCWPESLAPSSSDPNSWPVISGLVAVLRAPAVSADGKYDAAWAVDRLVVNLPAAFQLHPAVQAAVDPLVALLEHHNQDVQDQAATALRTLAMGCQVNQSLIGAEDGAISKLWQRVKSGWYAGHLVAVLKGHGLNQSRLMHQDGFIEDLMGLLAERQWVFKDVVTLLSEDNPDFVLRMCNTPTAVPALISVLEFTKLFCCDND